MWVFFQKNPLITEFQKKKKKAIVYNLFFQKEYAKCQMLFCGQEDVSKTYPSIAIWQRPSVNSESLNSPREVLCVLG